MTTDYTPVIQNLLASGRLTEAELKALLSGEPSEIDKNAVDALHTLYCEENHEEGNCFYYTEETLENCWQQTSHKLWLKITNELKEYLGLGSSQELLEKLREVNQLLNSTNTDVILLASLCNLGLRVLPDFGKKIARVEEPQPLSLAIARAAQLGGS